MNGFFHNYRKNLRILARRLSTQGVYTTLLWAVGRGVSSLTGVPLLRYSQVTPQLYVGSQHRASGRRFLERQGFNACVNMRVELDDAALGYALPRYLHLPTPDDEPPSLEHLDQGVAFIREVIAAGGKVYIHCGAGVGRAPSMAAAYLMSEGHTLEEALALIRKSRPFITINAVQLRQLERYEQRCRAAEPPGTSSTVEESSAD